MFESYKKRNTSVELFRLTSMLGIVVYHCILWGAHKDYQWVYGLGTSKSTFYLLALYSLGNTGVTCFMFISGYYGIKLNLRKLLDLILMMLFYIVIIRYLAGVSVYKIINSAIHPWDGWWFVKCYFLICILSPIINLGIEHISKKIFKLIILLLVLYTYLGHFLALKSEMNVELLLTIFLIARYFRLYPPQEIKRNAIVVCILSITMIIVIPIILSKMHSNTLLTLFLSNNNILILFFALSTVSILDNHPLHIGIINWLSTSTLSIYLITDNELRELLDPWLLQNLLSNPFRGLCIIVLICITCLFVEKLRIMLFSPLSQMLDKFNNNELS